MTSCHKVACVGLARLGGTRACSCTASPDGRAGECKVRGRAILEDDPALNEAVAAAVASQKDYTPVPGKFQLFRVDVDEIAFVRRGDDNDQYVTRWPPGVEQVRPGTSATSNAPPGPYSELLVPASPAK